MVDNQPHKPLSTLINQGSQDYLSRKSGKLDGLSYNMVLGCFNLLNHYATKAFTPINSFCYCNRCLVRYELQIGKKDAAPPAGGLPKDMPVQVNGFVAVEKLLAETLEVPGTLQPFEETEIRPEISGRLVSHKIQEGGTVQKRGLACQIV